MAINKSWGISSPTAGTLAIFKPTYSDFALITERNQDVVLRNTTTGLDQPYEIRYAAEKITNIYKDTGIDPAYFAVNKNGVSVLAQTRAVLRVSDSTDPTKTIDVPFEGHVVVRVPVTSSVAETDIDSFVKLMLGNVSDGNGANKIYRLATGALMPTTSAT